MEGLGAPSVTIQIVQYLVKQQEDGRVRRLEHTSDGLGTWRSRLCSRTERFDALVAGKLSRDVDPGRFSTWLRIPRVAHEDCDLGARDGWDTGLVHEVGYSVVASCILTVLRQVIERRQGVRLASTELSDKREDRRRVVSAARETSQHHSCVLA